MSRHDGTERRTTIGCVWAPALAMIVGLSAMCGTAWASSEAPLMLAPWVEGERFEMEADFLVQSRGRVRDPEGERVRLNTFESAGRFRFDPEKAGSPAIGYEVFHLRLNPGTNDLPERLSDQSVGFGMGIAEWGEWHFSFTAGAGFAGNLPYSDRDAWYGQGNLIATRPIDERSVLHVLLNYDGNRTLFPDIPLPYAAFSRRVSDELTFTAGIPYSAVHWRPEPRFSLDVEYTLLFDLDITATYEVIEDWLWAYGGFYNRYNAFHIEGDDPNRRVFFQQRRLEAGVRYGPGENWQLMLAGGYAFDQRLERGWDVRDLTTVAKFTNEPYLRLGFDVGF